MKKQVIKWELCRGICNLDGSAILNINDPVVQERIKTVQQLQEAVLKLKEIAPQTLQQVINI